MSKNIFITGTSSGLGLGFTQVYLENNDTVFGLSRRGLKIDSGKYYDQQCDLENTEQIDNCLEQLLGKISQLDVVIFNAGILGNINEIRLTPLNELHQIMNINVWANKIILDWLINQNKIIKQVIFISSGAAVNGNKGWSGYALSKATLNMLTQLYADEMPNTHLTAFAPGLVDTAMQYVLCEQIDTQQFPSIQKLINARNTENMPKPFEAAQNIIKKFDDLFQIPSGEFVDIRKM